MKMVVIEYYTLIYTASTIQSKYQCWGPKIGYTTGDVVVLKRSVNPSTTSLATSYTIDEQLRTVANRWGSPYVEQALYPKPSSAKCELADDGAVSPKWHSNRPFVLNVPTQEMP